ncbi:MAG: hypothetical protein Q9182_001200 [Xanthomendoza sp. 2 TL-2023]
MSFSSPLHEVYALSGTARAKFAHQMNAKDQRLRLLIAHAQLCDSLEEQVESLRKRRRTSSGEEEISRMKVVTVPNAQDPFLVQHQAQFKENLPKSEKVSGSCSTVDPAADCAVDDELDAGSPPKGSSQIIPVSNQGVEPSCDEDNNWGNNHGLPSITSAPIATESYECSYSSDSSTTITFLEMPVDDSLDSDSDSDSDTSSDYDCDIKSEISTYTQPMKATSISFSRPSNVRPYIRQDEDSDDCLDMLDSVAHAVSKQDEASIPNRFATLIPPKINENSEMSSDTTARVRAPAKPAPLAPLLCDEVTDASSAVCHDQRLQQALRQLLDSSHCNPEEISAHGSAFSRMFPSLASLFRSKDSVVVNATHDEKIAT